jgi:hypothetical protein
VTAPRLARRGGVAVAVVAYALVAALCRPLTHPALAAVLVAGIPLAWIGIRRRPRRAAPVDGRSAALWLGIAALGAAFELAVWLGPDDVAHPTLSTLADPVLSTYPGRVLGYLAWIGSGVWLASR